MKTRIPFLALLIVLLTGLGAFILPVWESNPDLTVNSVLGDESFVASYGYSPTRDVSDSLRIAIHLRYVEELLRKRTPTGLTRQELQNRKKYLDYLREYRLAGEFPVNDGYPGTRRPTFIDESGNICAVGYLVEQSAGRQAAERINRTYKYAYIGDIESETFDRWVGASGFTKTELAMIQPQYRFRGESSVDRSRMDLPYALATGGINTANILLMAKNSEDSWIFNSAVQRHKVGIVTGFATIVLGALNLDNQKTYYESQNFLVINEVTESNDLKTLVSLNNIGLGLFTVFHSGINIAKLSNANTQKKERARAYLDVTQIDTSPLAAPEPVPALQFTYTF